MFNNLLIDKNKIVNIFSVFLRKKRNYLGECEMLLIGNRCNLFYEIEFFLKVFV